MTIRYSSTFEHQEKRPVVQVRTPLEMLIFLPRGQAFINQRITEELLFEITQIHTHQ